MLLLTSLSSLVAISPHQAGRQQATRWTASDEFARERWRRYLTRRNLECLGDGGFRPGSQLWRERHLDPSPRSNVVDVAVGNERFARLSLFQAQRLRAQLDMLVEPVTLVSMFVLHRKKHPCSLLDHIGKAGQVQRFAVEVQA